MLDAASRLTRRAVEGFASSEKGREISVQLSPWGTAAIIFSFLLCWLVMLKIQYIFGEVISTLAIVEESQSPALVVLESAYKDADGKEIDKVVQPEVVMVKTKPISSRFRTAIAHLKADGGRHSHFRGLGLYLLSYICKSLIVYYVTTTFISMGGAIVAYLVAELLVANLDVAWVHVVISKSSNKHWSSRINFNNWMKIAPAAFLRGVAIQTTTSLLAIVVVAHNLVEDSLDNPAGVDSEDLKAIAKILVSMIPAALLLFIFVWLPAHVTFIRVAASMLPEEDEPVVAFDRSFNDKVVPLSLGGSGCLTLKDAWITFSWQQRRRYMGVIVKTFAIETVLTMIFFLVLLPAEVMVFFPEVKATVIQAMKF